jgi:hypothetical protein
MTPYDFIKAAAKMEVAMIKERIELECRLKQLNTCPYCGGDNWHCHRDGKKYCRGCGWQKG